MNRELWTFYQREEVAIPGKTFLFNAVILVMHVFVRGTKGGSIRTVIGLYSFRQFKMAGKVALTWPGGWSILRIKDVRAGNAWKGPREE
ncbi:MAG TPA: hypothetical protein VMW89_13125 [Desulfatiglandales bacterium]|nr:hypothetical protein [Desulfatiglandales bacterium]